MFLVGENETLPPTAIPLWLSIAGLVLTLLLIPLASWLIKAMLDTRREMGKIRTDRAREQMELEAERARLAQQLADATATAEDNRTRNRRAEDRKDDQQAGKHWRQVADHYRETLTARITVLERQNEQLQDECSNERDLRIKCEVKLEGALDVIRDLKGRMSWLEGQLRQRGVDPGSHEHRPLPPDSDGRSV